MEIRWLSVTDAALLSGYDKKIVYAAIERKELDGVGRPVRILETDLREWATNRVKYARKNERKA